MATAVRHLRPPARRVLLVAGDWLRFRLQRELEWKGCEVVARGSLQPSDWAKPALFDIVLIDAALLPEGLLPEGLRTLRADSPRARFVLLAGPQEQEAAAEARQSGFELVLERPLRPEALPELVRTALGETPPRQEAAPVLVSFELLENPHGRGKRFMGSAATSVMVHAAVLALVLIIPLAYTETLDLRELTNTWLMAPPPPPPPPPPPAPRKIQARLKPVLQTVAGKLIAPSAIPKEVAEIVDPEMDLDIQEGVVGGVPGGVAGGQLGGVLGGVLGGIPSALPPPPVPSLQAPVRVGGNVRPPRLIKKVSPFYPRIAKQARLEGVVRIDAIIDASGRVVEMKVLSGHPLLVQEALNAVRQWVYEPTLLNNQPVPVVLEVTVNFYLR